MPMLAIETVETSLSAIVLVAIKVAPNEMPVWAEEMLAKVACMVSEPSTLTSSVMGKVRVAVVEPAGTVTVAEDV